MSAPESDFAAAMREEIAARLDPLEASYRRRAVELRNAGMTDEAEEQEGQAAMVLLCRILAMDAVGAAVRKVAA